MKNKITDGSDQGEQCEITFSKEDSTINSAISLPPAGHGRAKSLRIHYKDFGAITFSDYEIFSEVPAHPFWSQVDMLIDFSFADELCAHLYSPNGQRPFAPSLKLKVHLVKTYYDLSDREMEERMLYDIAIKRFLGVPMSFIGFDHSTIGLDRDRMGSDLFHACFLHILIQARQHKLWGDKQDDRWLVDAFHTHAPSSRAGAYRLIMQATLRIFQHLKRSHPTLYTIARQSLQFESWFDRLSHDATPEERMLAFSQLVVRAHSLLSWFRSETIHPLFEQWSDPKRKQRSLELQSTLHDILHQYTKPADPDQPDATNETECKDASEPKIQYVKIPRKERDSDRIISASDPEIRGGHKSKDKKFIGDKVQVIESEQSHFILEAEPIPGNESDGNRLEELVTRVKYTHGISPKEVVADTTYGSGENRALLAKEDIPLCSPVAPVNNPKGHLTNEHFTYDPEQKHVTCPMGQVSTRFHRDNGQQAFQHRFAAKTCNNCKIKSQCTDSKKGRTIFISDYREIMQQAKQYNETEEGLAALKARSEIERTNNEMKNHHGLSHPRTKGRDNFRISVKLTATMINIKLMVKELGKKVQNPYVRYKRRSVVGIPMPKTGTKVVVG